MRDEKDHRDLATPEFRAAMQNAGLHYAKSNYKAPELSSEVLAEIRKKSRFSYKGLAKIAAVLVVVLIGGFALDLWSDANGVYGGKRFFSSVVDVSSSLDIKQEVMEDGQIMESAIVEDEKDIKLATDMVDTLYVPGYIPEGYAFDSLLVEKDERASSLSYIYSNKEGTILKIDHYSWLSNDESTKGIRGKFYAKDKLGGRLYVDNFGGGEYSVIRLDKREDTVLSGTGDMEEGLKVMEEFRKQ